MKISSYFCAAKESIFLQIKKEIEEKLHIISKIVH
jgi:hypothetical protein